MYECLENLKAKVPSAITHWWSRWTDSIRGVLARIRQIGLGEKWKSIAPLIGTLAAIIMAYTALMTYLRTNDLPFPIQQPAYDPFQQAIMSECKSKNTRNPEGCYCLTMTLKEILGPEMYEMSVLFHQYGNEGGEAMYRKRHGEAEGRRVVAVLRHSLTKIRSNANAAAKECGLNDYIVW